MTAYYNEIDPAAAHVLRHMIAEGVIAPGDVDTRSIKEVQPDDLAGYTQCHFFAGGGLWSVAARLAGWPDDRELWTGSCPCQPFSAAGKGLGTDDPRHLWPDFHRLIRARRPAVVMGEQVAGAAGYGWFDGVRADLAGEGYAGRAVDFPACSVDAPHQRNRLYWIAVAEPDSGRQEGRGLCGPRESDSPHQWHAHSQLGRPDGSTGEGVTMGDAFGSGLEGFGGHGDGSWRPEPRRPVAEADGGERLLPSDASLPLVQGQPSAGEQSVDRVDAGLHADADRRGRAGRAEGPIGRAFERTPSQRPVLRNGTYWSDADWIACHDGKARRAQSGIRFLVNGLPGRVDLWRVGGNAIVPEAAAEVIAAFMDVYGLPVRSAS